MADEEHVSVLQQGVEAWNEWRNAHPGLQPDLSHVQLDGADLSHAKLNWTNLHAASLRGTLLNNADLFRADLMRVDAREAQFRRADFRGAFFTSPNPDMALTSGANLSSADLTEATLTKVDLTGVRFTDARLLGASLSGSILEQTDLRDADLSGADLSGVLLIGARLQRANLRDCMVHGCGVWNVQLDGAIQEDLRVSRWDEPTLTVDNLEVAQFLYLMVHNDKIRQVIDSLTSKVVLILGRFTQERKLVLDALRAELRRHNYVPVLFDFERPRDRDFTETVTLLARMAHFIVADLTDPSSIPQELQAIVPDVTVPVQPIMADGAKPFSMFDDYRKHHCVLEIFEYPSLGALLAAVPQRVIAPAEAKVAELRRIAQRAGATNRG